MNFILSFVKKLVPVFVIIVGGGVLVYAAAPTGGYTPGSTLNPDCTPGSVDCVVTNPVAWNVTGNNGTSPGTNFIGTTDAQDVVFKTNSVEQLRITQAGRFLSTGQSPTGSTSFGIGVSNETVTGINNAMFGGLNGRFLTTGQFNSSFGLSAFRTATSASDNASFGYFSMKNLTIGTGNSGFGTRTFELTTTGNYNTAIGYAALQLLGTGSNNIAIGKNTNVPNGNADNQMNIGNLIYGTGMSGSLAGNIGIGTTTPNNKLEITQGTAGNSGLRFTNLTSATVPGSATSKFLTVDTNGDVVLLNTAGGSSPQWYAENATAPTPGPIATGLRSIALGTNAKALSDDMFVYGQNAGVGATNAFGSNFIGVDAGNTATNAIVSNFIGYQAGNNASSATNSNFIGGLAGNNASSASFSNFIGPHAGNGASNASQSNFIGYQTGLNATLASNSNFVGFDAGNGASNASNSNIIGRKAGMTFAGNNIGSNNIIIGTNISLPNAAADSMNIGGVLFGTGFYSTVTGNPSIAPVSTGRIGIGNVTPSYLLHVGSSAITSGTSVARFENAGGTCTITPNTAGGITCTSDINYKKDITDVSNTDILSKLTSLDIKSYRMTADGENTEKQIGFIAQNVETIFPHLVQTDTDGRKAVSYSGMTPVIVAAIKELNLKLDKSILVSGNSNTAGFFDALKTWLGNTANGLDKLFAREIETEKLCVKKSNGTSICINGDQLDDLLGNTSLESTGSIADNSGSIGGITGGNAGGGDTTSGSAGTTRDTTDTVIPPSDTSGSSDMVSTPATDTSDTTTVSETVPIE